MSENHMKNIQFHSFSISDVDDPEIYVAIPLMKFLETTKGKWVKDHCPNLKYSITSDFEYMRRKVIVYGTLTNIHATEFYLRWA